ncbi:MAG TPA: transporter, partial [Ideonella sp.]|nr:transporter [Ideonella sp.]
MTTGRRAGRLPPLWWALATAGLCSAALAAEPEKATDAAVLEKLEQLMQRVQQLEQRNGDLERRVRDLSAKVAVPAAPAATTAPTTDWGKPREERLVALEQQVKSLVRPVLDGAPDEEGPTFETSLVAVGQQLGANGSDTGHSQGRLNYRGDIEVNLPLGTLPALGDAKFSGFGHLRFGQGGGVALRPSHTATVNSVPFEAGAGSAESYMIVAQAFGQLEWATGPSRFNDLPGNRVELTAGKIDFFGFFDQNAVAGDEGAQFLN